MKIAVILGSARNGRMGERVSKWVLNAVDQIDTIEFKFMDVGEYDLPFMREAISPRYNPNRQVDDEVQRWLDDISWADGYVFITPEYNRALPGEFKNALDSIAHEGDRKPAAFVSYAGTPTAGLAAQQELRNVVNMLEIIPIPAFVAIPFVQEVFSEDGSLTEQAVSSGHSPDSMLADALDQLQWYTNALSVARQSN
jgi:NAD(P)H-dependent FMN reductase